MRRLAVPGAVLLTTVLFLLATLPTHAGAPLRRGLITVDGVALMAQPSTSAHVITKLVQQSQVEAVKTRGAWMQVQIWSSVRGWVPVRDVVFRKPWATVSTYHAPVVQNRVTASPPLPITAGGRVTSPTTVYGAPGGTKTSTLPAGSVRVSGWRQDGRGEVWYRVPHGWAHSASIRFVTPDPARQTLSGTPLWQKVAGKGMWLTLGPVADSDPDALVDAAKAAGFTHLYIESAISPLGFHGRESVGPLIDAAHTRHLTVLAWVYPYLYDIASDVQLTRTVAAYRTPSGNRFDGIAADLERNMTGPSIRAYSQLVRAYLGNSYLLVGVTYPPQSLPTYPFLDVARSFNVIAPMDYWHQTKTRYGLNYGHARYSEAYTRQYVQESIATIRKAWRDARIAPIGQVFDNYGHEGMGPYAPSSGEVQGFLEGAKTSHAIGVSFFQWMTATDAEWHVIHQFHY
jgi:hypothetical protein